MAISLSNLVSNLAERIHKTKCSTDMRIKNVKLVELNTKTVSAFLNRQALNIILREYNCLRCNKNYQNKRFANT